MDNGTHAPVCLSYVLATFICHTSKCVNGSECYLLDSVCAWSTGRSHSTHWGICSGICAGTWEREERRHVRERGRITGLKLLLITASWRNRHPKILGWSAYIITHIKSPTNWEPQPCIPEVAVERLPRHSRLYAGVKVLCVHLHNGVHLAEVYTHPTLDRVSGRKGRERKWKKMRGRKEQERLRKDPPPFGNNPAR